MSREMFGKKRMSISAKDLKQAVLKRNKVLESRNKSLEQDIVDKKKSLDAISKEISSSEKEYKSALSAIERAKKDAVEANVEAAKERIKTSKIKKQLTEALSKEDSAQSNLNKLTKESEVLSKKVDKMSDSLAIVSTLKEELKILKSDKKIEIKNLDELNGEADGIKKELSQLRTNIVKKKKDHKEFLVGLDSEVEDKKGILKGFDEEYEVKIAEFNTKKRILKDSIEEKEQETDVLESLVSQREKEFIEIESKCNQAENALMYAKELTNKEIDREKKEIGEIKEKFKQWKVVELEKVARLKLKKKIENIDKVGLMEILNG